MDPVLPIRFDICFAWWVPSKKRMGFTTEETNKPGKCTTGTYDIMHKNPFQIWNIKGLHDTVIQLNKLMKVTSAIILGLTYKAFHAIATHMDIGS